MFYQFFCFFVVLFTLKSFNVFAQNVPHLPATKSLHKKGYELKLEIESFTTRAKVDSGLNQYDFTADDFFQTTDFHLKGSYALTKGFQLTPGVIFRQISSKQMINNENYEFSKSAPYALSFDLLYSIRKDKKEYGIFFEYETRLFENQENVPVIPQEIELGDDGQSVALGLGFTYYMEKNNFFTIKSLYRNPAEDLSSEVFTDVQYNIGAMGSLSILLGFENNYSLQVDPYTNDPSNKPNIDRGNTERFNSVNRSWTGVYAGLNIRVSEHTRINLEYKQITGAEGYDLGQVLGLTLAIRNDRPPGIEKKIGAFKEYRVNTMVREVTKNKNLVVIGAGVSHGLTSGQLVDFYYYDYAEGYQLIAEGRTVKVGGTKSLVKITRRIRNNEVNDEVMAKALPFYAD